jgi:hypothetical protein
VPDLHSNGGRRTADETAQFASVGRRRAPESAGSPAPGRRRAPEEGAGSPPGGRRRAADDAPVTAPQAGASGRHRAGGDPGRHRTADTGLFPVVAGSGGSRPTPPAPRSPRSAPPVHTPRSDRALEARPREGWTAPPGLDPDLLTRPMRLSDQAPHARRPRVDGSVSGV